MIKGKIEPPASNPPEGTSSKLNINQLISNKFPSVISTMLIMPNDINPIKTVFINISPSPRFYFPVSFYAQIINNPHYPSPS